LGAHYTGEEDILLIVEPVLMAPLRREWGKIKVECQKLKAEADALSGKKRATVIEKISAKLRTFADKIAAIKVLDPACGSGNFLYVALRLLLDLQNDVINLSDELGAGRFFVSVTPAQLYGIETNEYAYELAQMTIQIGYIQWLRDNGYGQPSEPILKQVKNILHMDAIMTRQTSEVFAEHLRSGDEGAQTSEVYEPDWPEADVIVGNPPFLGDKKMRAELGDEYVETLRKLYEGRIPGQSDLVCYWFGKARAMIEEGEVKRAGLLATQGIRGGANRKVLERIKETGDIFWAQSDREWILDGATVHVSMVGFDNGTENLYFLDGFAVDKINSDLTTSSDLTKAIRLKENFDIAFIGDTKKGKFEIPKELAEEMLNDQSNPNGKSNSEVIKPWINALDITQYPRGMWIIDFGVDTSENIAALYEKPFEYVKKLVKPKRDKVRNQLEKKNWWLHGRPAPDMRRAISSLSSYIATPRVSKHRIFIFVRSNTIPDNAVVIFAKDDFYTFGVLHSCLHELWARATGTQLREAESGFRYSQTMTFETFPFPWPPGAEPKDDPRVKAIAQASRELVEQRDRWLNAEGLDETEKKKRTLTNLYNARFTWLELAHKKLDEAVFAAYGWSSDLSDEEILERLLALNLERAEEQPLATNDN